METTSKKTAIRLAVLSVGAMFIASLASSTHSGLANAQQNKAGTYDELKCGDELENGIR